MLCRAWRRRRFVSRFSGKVACEKTKRKRERKKKIEEEKKKTIFRYFHFDTRIRKKNCASLNGADFVHNTGILLAKKVKTCPLEDEFSFTCVHLKNRPLEDKCFIFNESHEKKTFHLIMGIT